MAATATAPELEHVRKVSPDAFGFIAGALAQTAAALGPDLLRDVRGVVHDLLDAGDDPGATALPDGLHELVEQFVVYVASTTQRQRERGAADLERLGGPDLATFMNALYVIDMTARLRLSLERLLDPTAPDAGESAAALDLPETIGETMSELHHAAMRLQLVDPETTELVRIKCGRHHDCRVCLSLRLADRSGHRAADESQLDKVDDWRGSDLPARQKAALHLAEAYLTHPAAIDAGLRGEVAGFFSHDETVELLLDIISWTQQKPLVALEVDVPISTERLMALELDENGHVLVEELV